MDLEKIKSYKSIVFDCDGVILNSNRIKTEAFRHIASPYGNDLANKLVKYHVENGGVSRYKKINYFCRAILNKEDCNAVEQNLLIKYGSYVKEQLALCETVGNLEDYREKFRDGSWLIVSGGDQQELREVFDIRGMSDLFDCGIYGSPRTKEDILAELIENGSVQAPALFIGDSKYDHEVSMEFGLDFLFVYNWTEMNDWRAYCKENSVDFCGSVGDLMRSVSAD